MFRAALLMTVSSASVEQDQVQISEDKVVQIEALSKLAESASQLLRYGASSPVISFTRDTLREIELEVLPAITTSHKANVKLLQDRHETFRVIKATYQESSNKLDGLRALEQKLSNDHKACRVEERTNCGSFTKCTNDLQELWLTFQSKKGALETTHEVINGKMCKETFPPTDYKMQNALYSWEDRTSFETFTKRGEQYFTAKDSYEAKRPLCNAENKTLVSTTKTCNDLKQELEKSSCTSLEKHSDSLATLNATWTLAQKELKAAEDDVKGQEKDRKIEFKSIKSIECLLGFINRSGGKPCDKQTGDAQVATCHSVDADSHWLNIEYIKEPAKPADLASAPHPCNVDFLKQESYGNLSAYCLKEPPSSWTLPDWTLPDLKSSECNTCEQPTTTAVLATAAPTTAAPTTAALVQQALTDDEDDEE